METKSVSRKIAISGIVALSTALGLTVAAGPASAAEVASGHCETRPGMDSDQFNFSLQYDKRSDGSKAVTGYSWDIARPFYYDPMSDVLPDGYPDGKTKNNVQMTLTSRSGETLDTWKSGDDVEDYDGHVDRSVTVPPNTQVQLEGKVDVDYRGEADPTCTANTDWV
jgi:hypothetical protein